MNEDLKKNKSNFVRIGPQPPNTDIKTYDIGNLFVISQGVSTPGATLGELYVEYTVVLMTPVYESIADLVPVGGEFIGNGVFSAANPFGNNPLAPTAFNYGIAIDDTSRVTFTNPGYYLLSFYATGTVITGLTITPDAHSVAGNTVTSLDSGGLVCNLTIPLQVLELSIVAFTATATTITASSLRVGTAPPQSIE
jgi:hypothetical protein